MDLMTELFKHFKLIGIFAMLLVAIIMVLIVVMSIGVFSNRKNRKSPILKVSAKVVSKRMHYSKSRNFNSLDTYRYTLLKLRAEIGWNYPCHIMSMVCWLKEIKAFWNFREQYS